MKVQYREQGEKFRPIKIILEYECELNNMLKTLDFCLHNAKGVCDMAYSFSYAINEQLRDFKIN